MDSTLISAPSSTKNRKKKRDPEAHSAKKGNTWYFGYKAHIGVDKDSGLVHTIKGSSANVHDVTMVPELLTGEEQLPQERSKLFLKHRTNKAETVTTSKVKSAHRLNEYCMRMLPLLCL